MRAHCTSPDPNFFLASVYFISCPLDRASPPHHRHAPPPPPLVATCIRHPQFHPIRPPARVVLAPTRPLLCPPCPLISCPILSSAPCLWSPPPFVTLVPSSVPPSWIHFPFIVSITKIDSRNIGWISTFVTLVPSSVPLSWIHFPFIVSIVKIDSRDTGWVSGPGQPTLMVHWLRGRLSCQVLWSAFVLYGLVLFSQLVVTMVSCLFPSLSHLAMLSPS
jgi:hypothetical protein